MFANRRKREEERRASRVQSTVIDGPLCHVSYSKDNNEVFHVGIEANGGKTKVLSD